MSHPFAATQPGYALNRTRGVFLATELAFADRFRSRLRGLLATKKEEFPRGRGLFIEPSRGVHMMGMRYAIDAVYLDAQRRVVHVQTELRPWRLGPVRRDAAGVLELPAGMAERTRTEVGDEVVIERSACVGPVAR